MLQTLLSITINGPRVGTSECEPLMTAEGQKRREKLPKDKAATATTSKETTSHPVPAVNTATDAAAQMVQPEAGSFLMLP